MKKKFIIAAALSLFLSVGTSATAAVAIQEQQGTEVVKELPEGQVAVESDAVNSEEVNTIAESQIARKMTRAEKAENAKKNDSWGGGITIISMCVVIAALIVLSILFLIFGKISSMMMTKRKREAHGVSKEEALEHHEEVDSGDTIAAIAAALHQHFNHDGHDMEDTILTIRRMKRAYSPWNSKIYNMRELPALKRNKR